MFQGMHKWSNDESRTLLGDIKKRVNNIIITRLDGMDWFMHIFTCLYKVNCNEVSIYTKKLTNLFSKISQWCRDVFDFCFQLAMPVDRTRGWKGGLLKLYLFFCVMKIKILNDDYDIQKKKNWKYQSWEGKFVVGKYLNAFFFNFWKEYYHFSLSLFRIFVHSIFYFLRHRMRSIHWRFRRTFLQCLDVRLLKQDP